MSKTPDSTIVPKKGESGADAYGLYIDYVVYSAESGRLIRQERYFLADNLLCKYVRERGNARAAWRAFPLPNHDDARDLLIRNIERYKASPELGVEMRHKPLVVELSPTDCECVKKHEPPYARFDGNRIIERALGKLDDETWTPTA